MQNVSYKWHKKYPMLWQKHWVRSFMIKNELILSYFVGNV
jgi:hypothetical protein